MTTLALTYYANRMDKLVEDIMVKMIIIHDDSSKLNQEKVVMNIDEKTIPPGNISNQKWP